MDPLYYIGLDSDFSPPQEQILQKLKDVQMSLTIEALHAILAVAVGRGHSKVVKSLLEDKRVDLSHDENYPFRVACISGQSEMVELLMADERVDPSARNNFAILTASLFGHLKVVELLLRDKRVDPSVNNGSAIRGASKNKHSKLALLLLKDQRVLPFKLSLLEPRKEIALCMFRGFYEILRDEADRDVLRLIVDLLIIV